MAHHDERFRPGSMPDIFLTPPHHGVSTPTYHMGSSLSETSSPLTDFVDTPMSEVMDDPFLDPSDIDYVVPAPMSTSTPLFDHIDMSNYHFNPEILSIFQYDKDTRLFERSHRQAQSYTPSYSDYLSGLPCDLGINAHHRHQSYPGPRNMPTTIPSQHTPLFHPRPPLLPATAPIFADQLDMLFSNAPDVYIVPPQNGLSHQHRLVPQYTQSSEQSNVIAAPRNFHQISQNNWNMSLECSSSDGSIIEQQEDEQYALSPSGVDGSSIDTHGATAMAHSSRPECVIKQEEGLKAALKKAASRETNPDHTMRPYPCLLHPYGCTSTFTSKNEWKRHIVSQHMVLQVYRCRLCPDDASRPNMFNRKDLFTQHLKRMHTPLTEEQHNKISKSKRPPTRRSNSSIKYSHTPGWSWQTIYKDCCMLARRPPTTLQCVFCTQQFQGRPEIWEEWLEHTGRHLVTNIKENPNLDPNQYDIAWERDILFRDWLLEAGFLARNGDKIVLVDRSKLSVDAVLAHSYDQGGSFMGGNNQDEYLSMLIPTLHAPSSYSGVDDMAFI